MLKKTLIICALLFLGTHIGRSFKEPPQEPPVEMSRTEVEALDTNILLLPLDSRPANTYSPLMVAKSAGLDVVMPSADALDLYKKSGDIENYPSWLLSVEADYYVISISQLCYGGLVASRTSDTPLELAKRNLESLKQLKEKIGDKPIYAFDTIQRLAITSSDARSSQYYSHTHQWAILKDEVENLGYTYKKAELEQLERIIPEDIKEDYLKARSRNHIINSTAIDLVKEGVIDYLILAQDDASTSGLHRAEREVLKNKVNELGLNDKVMIFPGADEVGVILVSRAITDYYKLKPTFNVYYRGISGNDWVAPFEDINFGANISRHLEATNATIEEDGLIDLFVVTPGGNSSTFAKQVNRHLQLGKKVVVCDVVITNTADPDFFGAMTSEIDLSKLTGFAGWNTAGNTLGLSVGQAIASLAREKLEGEDLNSASEAHFEYLLHRLAKDYYYKVVVKDQVERLSRNLGIDTMNIPENFYSFVEDELDYQLKSHLSGFYSKHFAGKVVDGFRLGSFVEWEIRLAWPRFFEIEIRPEISLIDLRKE